MWTTQLEACPYFEEMDASSFVLGLKGVTNYFFTYTVLPLAFFLNIDS